MQDDLSLLQHAVLFYNKIRQRSGLERNIFDVIMGTITCVVIVSIYTRGFALVISQWRQPVNSSQQSVPPDNSPLNTPSSPNLPLDPSNSMPPTPKSNIQQSSAQSRQRWPWTSERLVTQDDFKSMNSSDLELMRNEIYARHGWIFKRQDLQRYFNSQSWYKQAGDPNDREAVDNRIASQLNSIEKQNAQMILNHEQKGVSQN